MNEIKASAYARAGLLGNPSDGYNGKAISFIVRDFAATVTLSESDEVIFLASSNDGLQFDSVAHFSNEVDSLGLYGGVRLLKSATYQFVKYSRHMEMEELSSFKVSLETNIPRQLGLAGSSAIVVAMLRGLCVWNNISIEPDVLASMALAAENELGITAGLQDRVIQAYEGLVHMDFSLSAMSEIYGLQCGNYEALNTDLLSNVYIAFATDQSESTDVLHSDLKQRFAAGDSKVRSAIGQIADLVPVGKQALYQGDRSLLAKLIDANFDLRQSICKLNPGHVRMIETARACGVSAKYCGSGGAIVGTYPDESTYLELVSRLQEIGCHIFKPTIAQ